VRTNLDGDFRQFQVLFERKCRNDDLRTFDQPEDGNLTLDFTRWMTNLGWLTNAATLSNALPLRSITWTDFTRSSAHNNLVMAAPTEPAPTTAIFIPYPVFESIR
jgi:hypothetical protein